MRTLVKQLPNLITLTNLLAGCIGIILAFTEPDITYAAYLILLATVLDFLDGASARLVKATSNLGKELDSLADMVSFGVLPGMILFRIIEQTDNPGYLPYLGLLVPLASAIRLAKFNIDTRQAVTFIGLPTPASALFVSGITFFGQVEWLNPILGQPYYLVSAASLISLLMISNFPITSLKFSPSTRSHNPIRITSGVVGIAGITWLGLSALPFIILFYVLLSIFYFRLIRPV